MKKDIREKQGIYAVHVNIEDITYVYIGSGLLGDRVSGNGSKLRRNVHDCKQLQEVYNQVGACKIEILDICSDEISARDLENDYVDYYKKIDGVIVCNKNKAYLSEYERKLDREDVIEIKQLIRNGVRNNVIAKQYNVNPSLVSRIKTGVRWGSVAI